jgi:hypothetical protein
MAYNRLGTFSNFFTAHTFLLSLAAQTIELFMAYLLMTQLCPLLVLP